MSFKLGGLIEDLDTKSDKKEVNAALGGLIYLVAQLNT